MPFREFQNKPLVIFLTFFNYVVHYSLSKASYVAKTLLNLEHPISKKAKICKNIERICFTKPKKYQLKHFSSLETKSRKFGFIF